MGAWTIKVLSDEINKTGNLGHHLPPLHGRRPGRLGNKIFYGEKQLQATAGIEFTFILL